MVYVYDNEIVTYLNFGVDKAIERVRLDETNAAIEGLKNVQTLSPLLHQVKRPKSLNPQWLKLLGRLLFFNIFAPVLCRFQSVFLLFQDLLPECKFYKKHKIDLQTEKHDIFEPLKF